MTIKTRLFASLAVVLLIAAAISCFLYAGASRVEQQRTGAILLESKLLATTYLRASVRNQIVETYEVAVLNESDSQGWNESRQNVLSMFTQFEKVESDKAAVEKLKSIYAHLDAQLNEGISLIRTNHVLKGKKLIKNATEEIFRGQFIDTIKQQINTIQKEYDHATEDLMTSISEMKRNIMICFCILFLILFALCFPMFKSISSRLNQLVRATKSLANGNYDALVPVEGTDEISVLAKAFNSMLGRIQQRTLELEKSNEALKHSETQLKEAIQTRDDFLSIASHELKTPITSLLLQIQMTERYSNQENHFSPSQEKLLKVFNTSKKQVDRLKNLIENLLDVSRIQAGKLSIELEEVNLSEIIQDMIERFSEQLLKNQCNLILNIKRNVLIKGDHLKIEQIMDNLLSNTIKYAPGSEVKISLTTDDRQAKLTIEDQGPGIDKSVQLKIFDKYERALAPRSVGGLGLGLFIVKEIVNGHNGQISVESDLGKGTRFTIEFPLNRATYIKEIEI